MPCWFCCLWYIFTRLLAGPATSYHPATRTAQQAMLKSLEILHGVVSDMLQKHCNPVETLERQGTRGHKWL